MKISRILLLLVLLPAYSFGQSNWRNSVVTLRGGSILSGQINDVGWEYPPKEFEFQQEGQPVRKFSVDEVTNFATDRPVLYESHTITYDGESEDTGSLTKIKEATNLVTEKLFLEVKVNGRIGLLYMKARNGRPHYFLKQDSIITELLNRSYISAENNREIVRNEKYKQQLVLITNDCPDIQSELKRLVYNGPRLSDVIKKINICKNYAVAPIWAGAVNTLKRKSSYGFVVQGIFSNCNYAFYYDAPTGFNFGGGLFWELYSKKRPTKLSFYNEITYKKITLEKGTSSVGLDGDFECNKIKLINAIKFSSPGKKEGRFYGGLGINNGLRTNTLISGKSKIGSIGEDFSNDYEIGFTGMVGHSFVLWQKVKISPEIRYDYEYGVSNKFSFSNYSLNLQIGTK